MKTLNKNIQMALGHSIKLHDKQLRKGTDLPYSLHPVSLAMMLLEMNLSEDVITASLLHDIIEDTSWTADDIEKNYNAHILSLVQACTEANQAEKWEIRKAKTIDKFKEQTLEAKYVILADKLHNIFSMSQQYDEIGHAVWDAFSRGYEKQKWYYSSLEKLFSEDADLKNTGMYKAYVKCYQNLFESR